MDGWFLIRGQKAVGWHMQRAKWKVSQTKSVDPAKLCFENKAEIKPVSDKQRPRELIARRPILQEIVKRTPQTIMKGH